jgi:hypothetical protein
VTLDRATPQASQQKSRSESSQPLPSGFMKVLGGQFANIAVSAAPSWSIINIKRNIRRGRAWKSPKCSIHGRDELSMSLFIPEQ